MKKFKLLNKLKKVILVITCAITLFFSMPKKSNADIIQDFVDLILNIPDGIMWILNTSVGNDGRTIVDLNLKGNGADTRGHIYNFDVTPYDIFTSGLDYAVIGMDGKPIQTQDVNDEDNDGNTTELIDYTLTKLPILDINFFKKDKSKEGTMNSAEILRPVISDVYKSLRNLVLIVMLVILLYVGIRIVIASAVSDQVKYKQWIMDWVVGVCLVVLLQYIMSFMMNVNEIIVEMLGENKEANYYISLSKLGGGEGYSEWGNVLKDADSDVGLKYFVGEHLAVADASDDEKFEFDESNATLYIDPSKGHSTRSDWGDNGTVFINARIVKSEYATSAGGVLTAVGMTAAGAAIGSIVPGVGTAIGALVGGVIGFFTQQAADTGSADWADKTVYRCNIVEYIRTITSFGSRWVVEFKPSGTYTQFVPSSTDPEDQSGDVSEETEAAANKGGPAFYGYAVLYILLVIESLMFLYTYLKRVFKLAFYTMIAPLIAFMYPIDKLGDGKAQAFNTWFKEYLYNVLIQPLHLLLYTVFIYSAMALMQESVIYAIGAYAYMIAAEKFFKKIFGFDKAPSGGPGGLGSPIAGGLAMKGLDSLKGGGGSSSKTGNGKGKSGDNSGKIKFAKKPKSAAPTNSGGNTDSSRAPSGDGGSMDPSRNGSDPVPAAAPSGRGGRGSFKRGVSNTLGNLGGMGNEIRRRAARKISGGQSSTFKGIKPGMVVGTAARGAGKALGKAALRGVGAAGGAVLGLAGGALVGMAASAFTGEDKMASSMQTGFLAGTAGGVAVGNKAISGISDLYGKGQEWHAHNDSAYAAELAINNVTGEDSEFLDGLSDSDYERLCSAVELDPDKITSEKDLERLHAGMNNGGLDENQAMEALEFTQDYSDLTSDAFTDAVRRSVNINDPRERAAAAQAAVTAGEASRAEDVTDDRIRHYIELNKIDRAKRFKEKNWSN